MLKLQKLTVEYRQEPLGVESRAPRFGWQCRSDAPAFRQKTCRITCATRPEGLETPDLWDSGLLETDHSENIAYAGRPLASAQTVYFRVRVTGEAGEEAYADSRFETALYEENFTASWIAQRKHRPGWAPCFRKTFTLPSRPVRARLYLAGLGYGEASVNGQRVTEDVLEPTITNFEKIVLYAAYDVTALLTCGENVLGVLLGSGFYNQDRVWLDGSLYWGTPRLLAELVVTLEDGSGLRVVSDPSWKTDYSPITVNNVYGGEIYDARLEQPGWDAPGFDDGDWAPAVPTEAPGGTLRCRELPPIRRVREVKPVSVRHLHEGQADQTWIFDMGENFAGWARLKLPYSPAGSPVVLRFAEITEDGSLNYTSCGTLHTCALQQDVYIAAGRPGGETYEPRFTYHGFRYIEVTGVQVHTPELPSDLLTVYAVHTDLETNGSFTCDYDPINRLQTLGRRTILSNFHGIPEDCPVREKCGWLGDAQLVAETAIQNFAMAPAYEKYLEDIRTSREIYGDWTMIAPGKRTCGFATPLWGCAQVTIPWNLYLYYGDLRALEVSYPAMWAWVAHEEARSRGLIVEGGLGDWLPPGGNDHPERMPVDFSSTAEFYHVTDLTARAAHILGKEEDAAALRELAGRIREALNARFLDASRPTYGTLGADGTALAYGFCPEEIREAVAADALRILERCGGAHHTGIFGNKTTVPAMTEMGLGDAMLETLFAENTPSLQYMMQLGAGSVWEAYDDVPGQPPVFTHGGSLNHPMHFAFASWFYTHLAGIRPLEAAPGYKRFLVKPYPLAKMKQVSATRETPYGEIRVEWQTHHECFLARLTVPANTEALCELPVPEGKTGYALIHSPEGQELSVPVTTREGRACFTLPGGSWILTVRWEEKFDKHFTVADLRVE